MEMPHAFDIDALAHKQTQLDRSGGHMLVDIMPTLIGDVFIICSAKGLAKLTWESDQTRQGVMLNALLKHPKYVSSGSRMLSRFQINLNQIVKRQLEEYFLGVRKEFDIPLDLYGTPFQLKAWNALKKIPYGKTVSYQQQAIWLGDKNKVRAVGGANGKNPIPIILPCHRVIAKNGSLHGFTGGLWRKSSLLRHEKKYS